MRYSRPQVQDALRRFFQPAESSFATEIGELIQASIPIVTALDQTPYLAWGLPVGRAFLQAGVAAEFSYVAVGPNDGVAFQCTKIRLANVTAGTVVYSVRVYTAAQLTTAGLATVGGGLFNLAARDVTKASSSTRILIGSHTSEIVGQVVDAVSLTAGTSTVIELDPGIILYGDDPSGLPVLAVTMDTVNVALRGTIMGREWPLPI